MQSHSSLKLDSSALSYVRLQFMNSLYACAQVIMVIALIDMQGIHKRMVWFQKLIKNRFLNLHGKNIHPQRHQLSKFLMH
jgi:hypothetical protein